MTTIASVQGEGWSVIGYDSRVSEEDGRTYILPKENGKVFKNGNYIIGVAGDVRAINLLAHVFKPPVCTVNTLGVKLDKFITAVFIPELKKCFEEASYSKDGEQESQIIILVNGTIYEIGEDFSWCHDTVGAYAAGTVQVMELSEIIESRHTAEFRQGIFCEYTRIATLVAVCDKGI